MLNRPYSTSRRTASLALLIALGGGLLFYSIGFRPALAEDLPPTDTSTAEETTSLAPADTETSTALPSATLSDLAVPAHPRDRRRMKSEKIAAIRPHKRCSI